LLLAFDISTQDIVHFVLTRSEDSLSAYKLINELKEVIKYPFRGIVVDLRKAIISTISDELSEVPLQACTIHLDRIY